MKRTGKRYRTGRADSHYDVIIVGSGLGGLTSAALLSKMGKKVCVLEQHYTAGGFTHSYENHNYEWDVGIHYVGEVHKKHSNYRRLFDFISGNQLKWAHTGDVYDRTIIGNDIDFKFKKGLPNLKAQLKLDFPKENKNIDRFFSLVKRINSLSYIIFMNKLIPNALQPMHNLLNKVFVPKEAFLTTEQVLVNTINDVNLRGILATQWGDYGTPPHESPFFMHALLINSFFDGANVPVGGSWKIAETIIPTIQSSGGEVFTYARVKEILINEQLVATGVELDNGDCIYADKIISAADVRTTYTKLISESVAKQTGYLEKLEQTKPSSPYLNLFAGFNESAQDLNLPKENFWIFPTPDHTQNVERFKVDTTQDFPAVFISFGSIRDPEWDKNYPNKSTLQVIIPSNPDFETFNQWEDTTWGKRGADYDAIKAQLTEKILEVVFKQLPQLRGKVDFCELATPLSVKWFQNNQLGEIYGIDHSIERFQRNWFTAKTPIKNLYLTGQDTLTVGIAGGALFSGLITTIAILGWTPQTLKLLYKLTKN